jgi:hypothetical protein
MGVGMSVFVVISSSARAKVIADGRTIDRTMMMTAAVIFVVVFPVVVVVVALVGPAGEE